MKKSRIAKLVILLIIAASAAIPIVQARQQSSPQSPTGQPPAGGPPASQQQPPQEPKNLVVLKGMARPQLIQTMRDWSAALGVECNFCHQPPFENDTPRKHVARLMQRDYVAGMKHKDGSAMSCQGCHQGQPNPLRALPFVNAVGKAGGGLQVLAKDEVMPAMQEFTKALGVKCDYCHVQGNFGAETPHKQIARFMLTEFTRGTTKADGSATSCNDCHQGTARLLTKLPFPRREQRPAPPPQGEKKPGE